MILVKPKPVAQFWFPFIFKAHFYLDKSHVTQPYKKFLIVQNVFTLYHPLLFCMPLLQSWKFFKKELTLIFLPNFAPEVNSACWNAVQLSYILKGGNTAVKIF